MAAREKTAEKANLIAACLSQRQESIAMLLAAEKTFAEWDNRDDQVYDAL